MAVIDHRNKPLLQEGEPFVVTIRNRDGIKMVRGYDPWSSSVLKQQYISNLTEDEKAQPNRNNLGEKHESRKSTRRD